VPAGDGPRDSRGRWTRKAAGGTVGAAVVAGLMAFAGGGDATTSVGAALDAATSQSTVDADTAGSQRSAKQGDEADAWRRMKLKETEKVVKKDVKKEVKRELRCAVQSYSQVRQFFLSHPCDKVDQVLFTVGDAQGDTVVGSVVWVTMPSESTSTQFKQVEDVYGTGDVTPFGTEVLGLGGIRFTGRHYKSRQDGSLVVITETEPLRGHPSDTMLTEVATVADVLPPP
jgi:hypothetical protein